MFQDKTGREISWSKEELGALKRCIFDLSVSRSLTSFCQVVEEEQEEEQGGLNFQVLLLCGILGEGRSLLLPFWRWRVSGRSGKGRSRDLSCYCRREHY